MPNCFGTLYVDTLMFDKSDGRRLRHH